MIKFKLKRKNSVGHFKTEKQKEEFMLRQAKLENVPCYSSVWYYRSGSKEPNHPQYLNTLKNDHRQQSKENLESACCDLLERLDSDLPKIISFCNEPLTICTIPRAKKEKSYPQDKLLFRKTIQVFLSQTGYQNIVEDGTMYILRHEDTRTTHLGQGILAPGDPTGGDCPYWGIANDTCTFSPALKDKNILLIDDIYTEEVNIDEDFILTLQDKGVKSVTLYTIAYTYNRQNNIIEEVNL